MIIYFNLYCTKSKQFISIKILYLYGIPKYSREVLWSDYSDKENWSTEVF